MRIAVIGGGAAGMGAAWELTKDGHRVSLIEREARLGGHLIACPVPLADGHTVHVDVGVSDFNRATFTNVGALFDELGLAYRPICQHASFMHPDGRTAWFSDDSGINSVIPFDDQARFAAELARFRLECVEVLESHADRAETAAAYCDRRNYSREFRELYLYPRAQGSFPMPDCDPADYPIRSLVAFWRIHGLAGPEQADRNVLTGGMAAYPDAFGRWLETNGGEVRTGCAVVGVARRREGIRVRTGDTAGNSHEEYFDHIVFAVRGEQVLPLLEDASHEERDLFGALTWHRARVTVHRDRALMPDREEAWGAYNYVLSDGGTPATRPTITFYPAKLAHLTGADGVFVTMNPFRDPDPELVIATYFLSHPAAGSGAELAAARVAQIQGARNCWYCGSYLVQPWVHEPALATGVDLAELIRQRLSSVVRDGERLSYLDDFLASFPLFARLDPYALADIRLAAERFSVAAGERLFAQEDPSDGLYLIASGSVSLKARTPGDGQIELASVSAGGVIGEFSLLDGGCRSAEGRATVPTLGYRIDLNRFTALRASGRPAAFEILERLRGAVASRTRSTIAEIGVTIPQTQSPAASAPAFADLPDKQCAPLLKTFPGFDRFDENQWRDFAGLVRRIEPKRGVLLEPACREYGAAYVIARGALRVSLPNGHTSEQLVIHGPGAIAGTAALVDGGEWPAALDVREDSVLFAISARDFAALRNAHNALAHQLFDMIGQQMTRDLRRISRIRSRLDSQVAAERAIADGSAT